MGAVSLYTGGLLFMASVAHITLAAPVYEDDQALQTQELNGEVKGCYYNFEHYDEGDRILTNEPCLNCTCHNRMLMCYLRVCPFTKAIGQDCKVEKRPDQCCPVITCPQVPVALLTSSTTEVPPTTTALGRPDNYGCTLDDNKFYADGAQVPSNPKKPCELCYCIRNHTACVMQECTLNVEGCRPVYQEGICCPVRYDCDYDDVLTTPKPTVGLVTTPGGPAECRVNDTLYFDGEMIDNMTANPCEHCYCMRGEVVCAVQECGTPLQDSDCRALPAESGQCCPSTYNCANGTIPAQSTPSLPTSESLAQGEDDTNVEGIEEVPKGTEANIEVTSEKGTEEDRPSPVANDSFEIVPEKEKEGEPNQFNDAETQPASHDEVPTDHKEEAPEQAVVEETEETKPAHSEVPQETTPSGQYTEISVENVEINTAPPSINHETPQSPEHIDSEEQPAPIASDDAQSVSDTEELKPTEPSNQQESERQPETAVSEVESVSSELTTVKTEEVEKEEEAPRVPGEGSCLVEGKTYATDSEVPATDKCHKSCKCVNSIVVCEEIQCGPPPTNIDGCQPVYKDGSCCPDHYNCDTIPSSIPEIQDQVISTERPEDLTHEIKDITTEAQEEIDKTDLTTPAAAPSLPVVNQDDLVLAGIPPESLVPGTEEFSTEEPQKITESPSDVPPESPQQGTNENLSPESIHSESAVHGGSADHLEEQPVITSDESGSQVDEVHPSGVDQEESDSSSEVSPSSETTTQQISGGYDESKEPESNDSVSVSTSQPEYEHEHIETTQSSQQPAEISASVSPDHHEYVEITTKAPEETVEEETTQDAHEVEKEPEVPSLTTEAQQQPEISVSTVQEPEAELTTQRPAAEHVAGPDEPSHENDSIAAGSEDAVHSEDATEISSESPHEVSEFEESPKPASEVSEDNTNAPPEVPAQQQEESSSSEANAISHDENINAIEPSHDGSSEQTLVEESPVSLTTSSPPEDETPVPQSAVAETNDVVPSIPQGETSQSPEVSNEILQGPQEEPAGVTTEQSPPAIVETIPDATVAAIAESNGYSEQVQETTLSSLSDDIKPEAEHDQISDNVEKPAETEVQTPEIVEQEHHEPQSPESDVTVTTAAPEVPVQSEEIAQTEKSPEVAPQTDEPPSETQRPAENVPVETPAEVVTHADEAAPPIDEEPTQTEGTQDAPPSESSASENVAQPETPQEPLEEQKLPEITTSQPQEPVESPAEEQPEQHKPEETPEVSITTARPVEEEPVTHVGPSRPLETLSIENQLSGSTEKPETVPVKPTEEETETPSFSSSERPFIDEKVETIKEDQPVVHQEAVEPVVNQEPIEPTVSQVASEPAVSQETSEPVVNQESLEPVVNQEALDPVVNQEALEPVVNQKEPVLIQEPATPVVNQDIDQTPSEDVPASETVQEEVPKPSPASETEGGVLLSTDAPNLIPGEDLSGGAIKPLEAEIPSVPVPSEDSVLPGVELPLANVVNEEASKPVSQTVLPEQQQSHQDSETEGTDKAPTTTIPEHHETTQEPVPSSVAPLKEHGVSSTSEQPQSSTAGGFNPGSSFFQQWTPKPFEPQSTSEAPHQPEDSHYPSGGFEPEYEDDDGVSYGPGTCRYGGKVYLSAQQIPRDDPCDFCFCFRSDIICLQQSCPPPIKGCYQETIKGFCCPRYECHVSMATTLNLTTTTTTTTTTLPPLFFAHAYKGAATKAGCQVNGVAYNVGDRIASTSGPCLLCRCGANGQMLCDPTVCGPQETLLRQVMDAASVARRR